MSVLKKIMLCLGCILLAVIVMLRIWVEIEDAANDRLEANAATEQVEINPEKILSFQGAVSSTKIAQGFAFSAKLNENGTVTVEDDGDTTNIDVSDWTNVTAIFQDGYELIGIKADGTLVSSGNSVVDTALEKQRNLLAVAKGAGGAYFGITHNETVIALTDEARQYNTYFGKVKGIAGSGSDLYALTADGKVHLASEYNYDELNIRRTLHDWEDIVAIDTTEAGNCVGLKSDGTVLIYSTGEHESRSLDWTNIQKVSIAAGYVLGLTSDGTVVRETFNTLMHDPLSDWTDVVDISAGDEHSMALKTDGSLLKCKENYEEQNTDTTGEKIRTKDGYSVFVQPLEGAAGSIIFNDERYIISNISMTSSEEWFTGTYRQTFSGTLQNVGDDVEAVSLNFCLLDKNKAIITELNAGFATIGDPSAYLKSGDVRKFKFEIITSKYEYDNAVYFGLCGVNTFAY